MPPLKPARCLHLCLPKRGHRPEECEDACAVAPEVGRFAVADGATEGGQSGPWARMLVEEFLRRPTDPLDWAHWLPDLQKRWCQQVEPAPGAPPLPWFVDVHLADGAFATFLGLVLEQGVWFAQAVGDSCLFQVRGEQLVERFPVRDAREFGTTPHLLGSRTPVGRIIPQHVRTNGGTWQEGDRFWLLTDALAEWFLRQVEGNAAPWKVLEGFLEQPDQINSWVDRQRAAGQLRNDDITLVGVCL